MSPRPGFTAVNGLRRHYRRSARPVTAAALPLALAASVAMAARCDGKRTRKGWTR